MTEVEAMEPRKPKRTHRRRRKGDEHSSLQISGLPVVPLRKIDVGEPDANAEFFLSQKSKSDPLYLKAFFDWDGFALDSLENGQKFILFGQKGTGKTAILRHLQTIMGERYATSFIVFRKEIIEEAQLAGIAATLSASLIVDEEKIKESKFYYHAMKRLLLAFLLTKCDNLDDFPEEMGWFRSLYRDIRNSSVGQVAALVTDSVMGSLESVSIDLEKATGGIAKIDPSKAIKRSNDAFQKFAFEKFKSSKVKVRLFLDEMHFAYRDTDGLSADAALVRDTILAVREINERLIENEIDSCIYISIRSEFLEHQEIAIADVAHTIESYGIELSWESAPYNRTHPIFDLVLERLRLSIDARFAKDDLFKRFIQDGNAPKFLEYTWGKPRDIIRYFKCAISSYPNAGSIRSNNEFRNILRRYSQAAWQDQKAALASFVPKDSIPKVEEALQEIANHTLDGSRRYKKKDIEVGLSSAFSICAKMV